MVIHKKLQLSSQTTGGCDNIAIAKKKTKLLLHNLNNNLFTLYEFSFYSSNFSKYL